MLILRCSTKVVRLPVKETVAGSSPANAASCACSSTGRAADSKSVRWGFDSLHACLVRFSTTRSWFTGRTPPRHGGGAGSIPVDRTFDARVHSCLGQVADWHRQRTATAQRSGFDSRPDLCWMVNGGLAAAPAANRMGPFGLWIVPTAFRLRSHPMPRGSDGTTPEFRSGKPGSTPGRGIGRVAWATRTRKVKLADGAGPRLENGWSLHRLGVRALRLPLGSPTRSTTRDSYGMGEPSWL